MPRRWIALSRVLAASALVAASTGQAVTLADDAGRTVEFARPPQRIVTLAPSLTELVFAAGAGAAVVGTDRFSDAPEAARHVARVGDASRLDVEGVIGLRPDLVIVWRHGNNLRELGQLESAGIRLFFLEPRRLDDVPMAIERLGVLLGHESEAKARAAALRASLERLRRGHENAAPVSVYYQVWSTPLMTINGNQLINDVIALCGGRNVFAALTPLVPVISTESVVAADPQAMFTADREEGGGAWLKRDPGHPAFALWQRHPGLTAVRHGWLFAINGDAISRQGPRVVAGAEAMCSALDTVRREADAEAAKARPGRR